MAKEKCDRNCATCSMDNRTFCALQIAIANQELIVAMQQQLNRISGDLSMILSPQGEPVLPDIEDSTTEPIPSGAETENINNRRV